MGLLNKFSINTSNSIENISIQRLVPKCKDFKTDTLFITTRNSCELCKQYNRKVYSLYGWNKKYPKIPDILLKDKCPACGKGFGAAFYFPGISSPIKSNK